MIFGQMKPLSVAEFLEIYHKTGIDVDDRLDSVKECYDSFELACSKYVQYAQELPGFTELAEEDRLSSLKGKILLDANLHIIVTLVFLINEVDFIPFFGEFCFAFPYVSP